MDRVLPLFLLYFASLQGVRAAQGLLCAVPPRRVVARGTNSRSLQGNPQFVAVRTVVRDGVVNHCTGNEGVPLNLE